MLRIKTFNDFIIHNTNIPVKEVIEKLFSLDQQIALYLTNVLFVLLLPAHLNHSIVIICCSIIEYLKYKFAESLEPKDN